ncbi:MAG: uracil-DNA glycosylase [Nitrospirae bacterium]|nr:uracil-DNA glycosylase [Nitrospirota bacterium]
MALPAGNAARPAPAATGGRKAGPEPASAPAARAAAAPQPVETTIPAAPPAPDPADSLTVIQAELDGCTRCTLANGRTHLVFGVGNPHADIVFVGEAPGRDEDLQGIPFVGRAGQLLTDIIEKGMGIPRASVYICNTVKCRPPDNRNPLPDELARCEPFLVRQLLAIRPKVIVAMGKFAAQAVCRSDAPISRLRGNWHKYEDIDVMPTYHPAYLLRNPSAKREVWDDIRQVMERVGLPVRARP